MTSLLGNTRKADLIFHSNGRIDITSNVAQMLGLRKGDVIDILYDKDEYYLYVRHRAPVNGRHEAMVFPANGKGNCFRACSSKLCKSVIEICGTQHSAKLCTGASVNDDVHGTMLPIIIKMPL